FELPKRRLGCQGLKWLVFGGSLKMRSSLMYPIRFAWVASGMLAMISGLWADHISLFGQSRSIDVTNSSLKVRVFKSGLFSAFAHDHEIEAPIDQGTINSSSNASVQLIVDARKMRVLDPQISGEKRSEIQRTMQGPSVLDSAHFPEISFRSVGVKSTGNDLWEVHGNLTLHGQVRSLIMTVALRDGHY